MAILKFFVENNELDTLAEAFALRFGYPETVPDENGRPINNPASKMNFANEKIAQMIDEIVKDYQRSQTIVNLPPSRGAGGRPDNTPTPPGNAL